MVIQNGNSTRMNDFAEEVVLPHKPIFLINLELMRRNNREDKNANPDGSKCKIDCL